MKWHRFRAWAVYGMIVINLMGCCNPGKEIYLCDHKKLVQFKNQATAIEYPDVHVSHLPEAEHAMPPRTLKSPEEYEAWELTLEEAVRIALSNSKVMRDIGARVLTAPAAVNTVYEPAIQESDPRFGVEAALSAFDTQFTTNVFWEKNDRIVNQIVPQINPRVFQQDSATFQAGFAKTGATGTQYYVRNNTSYDQNNSPNNRFPSVWDTNFELGFQHPLLQGGGIEFNRIAGPNASPGFFFSNGVLIARINHDISLTDFEASVRDLVSNVENSYWDLYFAYRTLDARVQGRNNALQSWRTKYARQESPLEEAQARDQYYLFRGLVEDALSGAPGGSTQSGSGSRPGTFRGAGGVYARESDLRLLLGIAPSDARMIRPVDEPSTAEVEFDWNEILPESLCRRVELRRQRWVIKRRELEYIASKNFLRPRLDALGQYRWRGQGDHLLDPDSDGGPGGIDNAFGNLMDGNHQEWQLGLQFSLPIGFRQALAAVRNAQLNLTREKAVMQEQELHVVHDLSSAIRELHRSYQLTQTHFNRRIAAQRQLDIAQADESTPTDQLLASQRSLAEAESAYYQSLIEYNLAIKAVHYEKGSLLEYNGIALAEGAWPCKAYVDAKKRARRRALAERIDYGFTLPEPVSQGRYQQNNGESQPATIYHNAPSHGTPTLAPAEEVQPRPASPTPASPRDSKPSENDRAPSPPLPMPITDQTAELDHNLNNRNQLNIQGSTANALSTSDAQITIREVPTPTTDLRQVEFEKMNLIPVPQVPAEVVTRTVPTSQQPIRQQTQVQRDTDVIPAKAEVIVPAERYQPAQQEIEPLPPHPQHPQAVEPVSRKAPATRQTTAKPFAWGELNLSAKPATSAAKQSVSAEKKQQSFDNAPTPSLNQNHSGISTQPVKAASVSTQSTGETDRSATEWKSAKRRSTR